MKKVRKILLLVPVVALLIALVPATVVLAGPPSPPNYGIYNPTDQPGQPPEEAGVEKVIPSHSAPGGTVRIITDPLAKVGTDGLEYAGWVTFRCQSALGFQYNIGTTSLDRLSRYSVKASAEQILKLVDQSTLGAFELEYPGSGIWVVPVIPPVVQDVQLGTFKTDAQGRGGVNGVYKLEPGFVYELTVKVYDASDTAVLEPGIDPYYGGVDTNGIIVY
jgi:hypothetical protein